jgi:hypothetical protein
MLTTATVASVKTERATVQSMRSRPSGSPISHAEPFLSRGRSSRISTTRNETRHDPPQYQFAAVGRRIHRRPRVARDRAHARPGLCASARGYHGAGVAGAAGSPARWSARLEPGAGTPRTMLALAKPGTRNSPAYPPRSALGARRTATPTLANSATGERHMPRRREGLGLTTCPPVRGQQSL